MDRTTRTELTTGTYVAWLPLIDSPVPIEIFLHRTFDTGTVLVYESPTLRCPSEQLPAICSGYSGNYGEYSYTLSWAEPINLVAPQLQLIFDGISLPPRELNTDYRVYPGRMEGSGNFVSCSNRSRNVFRGRSRYYDSNGNEIPDSSNFLAKPNQAVSGPPSNTQFILLCAALLIFFFILLRTLQHS